MTAMAAGTNDSLLRRFRVDGVLGQGAAATVYAVTLLGEDGKPSVHSTVKFAAKVIPYRHPASISGAPTSPLGSQQQQQQQQTQQQYLHRRHAAIVQREIALLREMQDHPLVVRLHAVLFDATRVVLVMEHAAMSLAALLRTCTRHARLEEERHRRHVVAQVLSVLQLMHFRGIAFRDVSAGNVLVRRDGSVCVCDLGLACRPYYATATAEAEAQQQQQVQRHQGRPPTSPSVASSSSSSAAPASASSNNATPKSGGGVAGTPASKFAAASPKHYVFERSPSKEAVAATGGALTMTQRSLGKPLHPPLAAAAAAVAAMAETPPVREFVGSPAFMSPSLVRSTSLPNPRRHHHGGDATAATVGVDPTAVDGPFQDDLWALGVLHYMLAFSRAPLQGESEEDTLARIAAATSVADIPMPAWPALSEPERDFMLKLLAQDPAIETGGGSVVATAASKHRMTATEAMSHPWMQQMQQQQIKCNSGAASSSLLDFMPRAALAEDGSGPSSSAGQTLLDLAPSAVGGEDDAAVTSAAGLPPPWLSPEMSLLLAGAAMPVGAPTTAAAAAATATSLPARSTEADKMRDRLCSAGAAFGAVHVGGSAVQQQPRKTSGWDALKSWFKA